MFDRSGTLVFIVIALLQRLSRANSLGVFLEQVEDRPTYHQYVESLLVQLEGAADPLFPAAGEAAWQVMARSSGAVSMSRVRRI